MGMKDSVFFYCISEEEEREGKRRGERERDLKPCSLSHDDDQAIKGRGDGWIKQRERWEVIELDG